MRKFLVTWEIEIEAESPFEAARKALEIHRDPASIATVFDVHGVNGSWRIDATGEGKQ